MDRILDQEDPIGLMNEKDNFPFTIVLSRIGTNKRMVFRCVKDNSEIQFLTSDIVDWETEFFIPKLRSFKKLNFDEMRIMESNFANLNEVWNFIIILAFAKQSICTFKRTWP